MSRSSLQKLATAGAACLAAALSSGCVGHAGGLELGWDSSRQIWRAEASQVKVRTAQSRFFDTTDKIVMLEAVVATLQDLGFQIEVLDEALGIVSAKQYLPVSGEPVSRDPSYLLYDEESLVVFQNSQRTWGPFEKREDLVRLTVTVRRRNEKQLVVRASAQHYLRPVENPEPYQSFYAALELALFSQRTREDVETGS
jgi:hypothetical protein